MNPKFLVDKYTELNKLDMQETLLKKKQSSIGIDVTAGLKTISNKRSSIKKDIVKYLEAEIQTLKREIKEQ